MSWLIAYLKKEIAWSAIPWFILKATAISLLTTLATALILEGLNMLDQSGVSEGVVRAPQITLKWFFEFGIASFLVEEVLFRAPLFFPSYFGWHRTTIVMLVISSVLFGYAHGNAVNILMQGVSGAIFGIVFLKCGGMNGKILKPLFASTGTHACFDFFLMAPAMLLNL